MKKLVVLILFCIPLPLFAQGFDYKDIEIAMTVKGGELAVGQKGEIVVTFTIPFGYSLTTNDQYPEIKLMNDVPGLKLGKLVKSDPHYEDATGGHWEFEATSTLPFYFSRDVEPAEYEAVFGFVMQACEKNGMCYFPSAAEDVKKKITIKLVKKK